MKWKFYLIEILTIMAIISGCCLEQSSEKEHPYKLSVRNWAYQLQNVNLYEVSQSDFELVVIDYSEDGSEEGRYSSEEIQLIKASGIVPIAYISIGEAENYRFYWQEDWNSNPPDWLGKENPNWKGNYGVKYWRDEWKSIIFSYLDKIMEQGFSGVYLDRVDAFEYWSNKENSESMVLSEEDAAKIMIQFIKEIAEYCRNKTVGEFYIIPQNGEKLLEYDDGSLLRTISAWAAEDLFYDGTEPISTDILQERTKYLGMVSVAGKPVFSVDYVDDGSGYSGDNRKRIEDYREKALNSGYIPYAARYDRELDELNIIKGVQP